MDVTIDKFGRIVIPKSVRDWLGLEAGTELKLEVIEEGSGERAIALRAPHDEPLLVDEQGLLVYTGALAEKGIDIVEHIRENRRERNRQAGGQ